MRKEILLVIYCLSYEIIFKYLSKFKKVLFFNQKNENRIKTFHELLSRIETMNKYLYFSL